MSLEQDFHNFIESQNPDEKRQGINQVLSIRAEQSNAPAIKRPFSWKKFFAAAIPSVATLCVGLILVFNFLPKGDPTRYCAAGDYNEVPTTKSIQEYATENNLPILYFDNSTIIDYIEHKEYQLNSGESIGFREDFIDPQGYLSYFRVTNKNVLLESLSLYETLTEVSTVDNCSVHYEAKARASYATFTYGNYRYYLEVEDVSTDYILDMVEILIPDIE